MNELLFLLEIGALLLFSLLSYRHSKELLLAWILLQALFSNLFILKEIELFTLQVTPTDPFFVSSLFCLNLFQGRYGQIEAKRLFPLQLFSFLFVVTLSLFQVAFLPAAGDSAHRAYETLLLPMPRILLASLATLLAVQRFDLLLFGALKGWRSPFWRSVVSLSLSQILDTLLFTLLGLVGLLSSPLDLILFSLAIKGIVILALSSFTPLLPYVRPLSI